jgi:hypothetical protein
MSPRRLGFSTVGVLVALSGGACDPASNLGPADGASGGDGGGDGGGGGGGGGGGQTGSAMPAGVAGTWTLEFRDEFDGTSLDLSKWSDSWFNGGTMNNVATLSSNVAVGDGVATLKLSSSTQGALIHTEPRRDAGGYCFPVDAVIETRMLFPGDGTSLSNWPAFWVNNTGYGDISEYAEHDIAEVLGSGSLTVNYHSPSGAHNQGAPSGYWGGAYHTFALHRKTTSADVYWDGQLVQSYSTDDLGMCLDVIFNVGVKNAVMTDDTNGIKVDYVRAWE